MITPSKSNNNNICQERQHMIQIQLHAETNRIISQGSTNYQTLKDKSHAKSQVSHKSHAIMLG